MAVEVNRVTVQVANLSSSVDEFSEEFSICVVAFFIDFFSSYDQVELDKESRDLTRFQTPLGLKRMKTLRQGATNSVAQLMRIVTRILAVHLREKVRLFAEDIRVKRPKILYGN